MYQKILNFDIFLHENFHFLPSYLTAGLAKTTAHRMLFLVSMDSQRSKKFDGSHFRMPTDSLRMARIHPGHNGVME